ncbi:MAG: ComF family protein [Flavobacteriales bacterium]|nr:ComF family protein [Flavobacteriales bacterium]
MVQPHIILQTAYNVLQLVCKEVLSYLVDFFDFFFPKLCAGCDAHLRSGETDLCLMCIFQLPKTYFWDYDVNPIEKLFRGRLKIDGACVYLYFQKGGKVQQMLHRMKYKGQPQIGKHLGIMFAHQLVTKGKFLDVDVIVPVPLHHTRMTRRGYNQSMFIARGMAEVMHCRVDGRTLVRNHATLTQTKKSRYDRSTNVESVFGCEHPEFFKGKHVLLVDDVVTTGSTLEAAGRVLLEAGVAKLYIAALACPD